MLSEEQFKHNLFLWFQKLCYHYFSFLNPILPKLSNIKSINFYAISKGSGEGRWHGIAPSLQILESKLIKDEVLLQETLSQTSTFK